ncbi:MAG: zinc ABC transporter substrate-binding protein [Planctomycetaceae bacterium]
MGAQVILSPLTKAVTAQGFRDQWIELEDAVTHKHGPEGEHTHAGLVATTWLDPLQFREQIQVVQLSLVKLLPDQREAIEERTEQASRELQALHERWENIRELLGDQPLIASHPVYHYLRGGMAGT